jgi:hypothetical protein
VGVSAEFSYGVNDWHYVRISAGTAPGELTWTNLAGVSWTLFFADGKIKTGDNCPYTQYYWNESDLQLNDEGTLFYFGEPYERVVDLNDYAVYDTCDDSDVTQVDLYGDGCAWYDYYPADCGKYDTNDFDSIVLCCGCHHLQPEETVTEEPEEPVDPDSEEE